MEQKQEFLFHVKTTERTLRSMCSMKLTKNSDKQIELKSSTKISPNYTSIVDNSVFSNDVCYYIFLTSYINANFVKQTQHNLLNAMCIYDVVSLPFVNLCDINDWNITIFDVSKREQLPYKTNGKFTYLGIKDLFGEHAVLKLEERVVANKRFDFVSFTVPCDECWKLMYVLYLSTIVLAKNSTALFAMPSKYDKKTLFYILNVMESIFEDVYVLREPWAAEPIYYIICHKFTMSSFTRQVQIKTFVENIKKAEIPDLADADFETFMAKKCNYVPSNSEKNDIIDLAIRYAEKIAD